MKKLLTAIAASVFFISPCVCTGDYVIHLKDGGRILVDKYSEDADTIRVKKFGGMMGISKALVSRIEEVETETPPEVKKVPEEGEEKRSKEGGAVESQEKPEKGEITSSEPSKGEASVKTPTPEGSNKPKNIILKEFDRLKKEFVFVEQMSKEELYQFDKDLMTLRNNIVRGGLAGVYADQLTEILSMGSKMEDVLKGKGQL